MASRREFIRHAVAISAVPYVLDPAIGVAAHAERMTPVLGIFDRRYVESRSFASTLAAHGVPTHGIAGDVTALWYDDLYHRWAAGPSPIVGLTAASSLFCLEHLAWKVERRVVFRAGHHPLGNGRVEHRLTGPEPFSAVSTGPLIEEHWPSWSASAVQRLPATLRRGARFEARATSPAVPGSAAGAEPLVTWVIALKPAAGIPGTSVFEERKS